MVKDEVEAQLNNEVQLIENIKVSINPEYFSFQINVLYNEKKKLRVPFFIPNVQH